MDATMLIIAFGLAMDAFSVSMTNGLSSPKFQIRFALKMALFFGFFQAFMPVLGWFAGQGLISYISGFDHWIAFGLLLIIGCKMIYESVEKSQRIVNSLNNHVLLVLAIATSIDALTVGLSFALLKVSIVTPAIAIGLITLAMSFLGVYLGNKFASFVSKRIELLGGVILIIIGLKILADHLLF